MKSRPERRPSMAGSISSPSSKEVGRLNELLGAASAYSRGLATQFGLEEQEGVPTVAPELVPTSDVHMRPEQWALHGGTLLWGRCDSGSATGFNSQAELVVGRGELMIVEGILFVPSVVAARINVGINGALLRQSTGNLVSRDSRRVISPGFSGNSGSLIMQENGAAVTIASIITRIPLPANGPPVWVPLDLVLVRPDRLKIWEETTGQALEQHIFFCRVRPGTPRELAVGSI